MTATQSLPTMTKGEFARLINVTPGRVSQYIASGQIGPDALDGTGRSARIIVDKARRHLTGRLDVAQRLGLNGIATRTAPSGEPKQELDFSSAPPVTLPRTDAVADQIALEKLEQAKMQTARARREEALAEGRFIYADEAKAEITRAVAMAYRVMEGGLADMATYLAGQFEVPQRDILHHLQRSFRDVRARAAQGFRESAENEPAHVSDEVAETDEDEE
ncbi:hypothetical protein ACFQ3K_03460 [Brucella gallinifaecis]|uniref:Uncharacterized protein n=1 Tax=Brucella gallinifaecis TaxID=215590 RepID=A0A502BL41_9HYPH|nr:hypothetical protein [Brucella gallinifaecis]TPF75182.1 hypothetical protein FHY56_10715 [Brucella gallinifaecis]